MYQCFSSIYIPVCIGTPFIHSLRDDPTVMWAGLIVLYVCRSIAGPSCFTAIGCAANSLNARSLDVPSDTTSTLIICSHTRWPSVDACVRRCLVNNAAAENVGAVNGIATSCTALARGLGPAIAGQALGWSLAGGLPMPWDFHLPFFVLGLVVLLSWVLTCFLPEGMDIRIEDRVKPVEHSPMESSSGYSQVNVDQLSSKLKVNVDLEMDLCPSTCDLGLAKEEELCLAESEGLS